MNVSARQSAFFILASFARVDGTSIKMDFLPSGHVRTDPIISQTCLSDHVHTFYGTNVLPYPDLTFDELVSVADDDNTGNVAENKSLYWHPTVYKYDRNIDTYTRDEIAQTSAYYIWSNEDGRTNTKAFPEGFRMIAGTRGNTATEFPNAFAECVGRSPCVRDDCYTENTFFPKKACYELEVSIFFPGCWDGVNLDSEDHMSHVAYSVDGEPDGRCPRSHPVRIPVIGFFFRIFEYDGGWHTFSDGSSIYHADYVSGWDEAFLQDVLDNCENDSLAAMPNAFCDDFLTFRDAPKCSDDDCDFADPELLEKLRAIQPPLKDFEAYITDEETLLVEGDLPRGTCTGTLFPRAPTPAPNSNTPAPNPTNQTPCYDAQFKLSHQGIQLTCQNLFDFDTCSFAPVQSHCPNMCNACSTYKCEDSIASFAVGNKVVKCRDLQNASNEEIDEYCMYPELYTTCRGTCKICDE